MYKCSTDINSHDIRGGLYGGDVSGTTEHQLI